MQVFIYCKITLLVSGVHRTHHQEYIKLQLKTLVQQQPSSNAAKFGHVGGRLLFRYYDLYQKLQLQFYVLLIMGAMDIRNM
jgi:hypothetical protein